MTTPSSRTYMRYVAIGDSSTEGLDDPDGRGGFRGWANRLAERIATAQGSLLYANLAVRGRRTRHVLEEQLEPALALGPDLATVFAGTNDVVRPGFDADRVARDMEEMERVLVAGGATVLTFTMPDLSRVMPIARLVADRVVALNEGLRAAAAGSGAVLVDLAAHPVACDARLWSDDRLHANAIGHARIAEALAHALAVPGSGGDWMAPLPALPPASAGARLAADLRWGQRYFLPWLWRRARGRSSGDGAVPKRPALLPVELPE